MSYPCLLDVVYRVLNGRNPPGKKINFWHHYDDYYVDDDGVIEWHNYDEHRKRKTQKVSIKKELIPVSWHPSRWWDWCVPEDEKRKTEILWA